LRAIRQGIKVFLSEFIQKNMDNVLFLHKKKQKDIIPALQAPPAVALHRIGNSLTSSLYTGRNAAPRVERTIRVTVRQKILAACFGFVSIVAVLGLLARQLVARVGDEAGAIYDHAFVGIFYVNQAQAQFLRISAEDAVGAPLTAPARRAALQAVLAALDVAVERAGSDHTRAAARHVQSMVAALPGFAPAELPARMEEVDRAIAKLVRSYSSEGLKSRDNAAELVVNSGRVLLGEIAAAIGFAFALALLLGRNLSPPLMMLVRVITKLTSGELDQAVEPRLLRRGDEIGAVARAAAFFREAMQKTITTGEERARLAAETEAARLDAERKQVAVTAKSDFLAAMSHEIRTPMNGVATIADLLADTPLSADQLRMVGIIRQSARWLIRVINDILDFSKLEANQLQIESVPFMLDEVIDSACEVLAAKAKEKGIALRVEGSDLPGYCRIGDPLRLRQILLNLLGNAVKFTASGSVTVIVQAEPAGFSLSVADTGIGIAADNINRLFQPYNQLRSDIARSFGGTGLGLSITKNLVELMGGSITVTSELGRGTCFTVNLALASDVAKSCKAQAQAASSDLRWQKPAMEAAVAHRAVILCAEDNAINREVLARVLDRLGFNHEMAVDGRAALALLDRRRHGLLLTDAQMPVLDGWQLTESIRHAEKVQDLPRLPIVMLTANALSESDSRIVQVGIDFVLTKPLDIGALEATLLGVVPALGALRQAAVSHAQQWPPTKQSASVPVQEIDLTVLIKLVGDDSDTIGALLDEFLANAAARHKDLKDARQLKDRASVAKHAHTMKGAARYAGARRLAHICEVIETCANAGDSVNVLSEPLAELDAAIACLPDNIAAALSDWRAKSARRHEAVGSF
jgi:signal transduction histidine kinase/CheY-like chemotaxis protein/HPt (histidine-containing phosphotransfer) domain-containing protein